MQLASLDNSSYSVSAMISSREVRGHPAEKNDFGYNTGTAISDAFIRENEDFNVRCILYLEGPVCLDKPLAAVIRKK